MKIFLGASVFKRDFESCGGFLTHNGVLPQSLKSFFLPKISGVIIVV
jgi:hypothetical protein